MGRLNARLAHILSDSGPKLFRDLVSLLTGQTFSMVVGFIAFAYLARTYEPEDYGNIEFVIAIASFFAIVIECGAGTIGVRQLAKTPEKSSDIATQVVSARLFLAILIIPLIVAIGYFTDQPPIVQTLLWIYAFSLLAVPFKQEWLLQGTENIHQAAAALPIRTAIFTLFTFILVGQGASILTVGVVEILAVVAVSAYYLFAQYRWTVPFSFGWRPSEAVYYLKEGLSVGLSNMLWAFMLYAPMFLLVSLVGGEEPAWLGASSRLVISLMTLSFIYHFNLYPVITRTVLNDTDGWQRVIQASVRLVSWAGIGFALGVTLFSPVILTFVFGGAFVAAAPALMVLIWLFPMRMLSGHARWSLIAAGHQKFLLYGEILGSLVLLAVGFVAIPHLGATGAALALISGIFASGLVTQIAANRFIGALNLPQAVALPIVAAAIGAGVAYSVTDVPFYRSVIGCSIFSVVLLINLKKLLKDLQRIGYAKEV